MKSIGMGMSVYFHRLERLLDCPKTLRKPFLSRTRRMAEDFVQGRPDVTQQELTDYLGEPEELAQGFLETLEPGVLKRYKKKKKLVCWALAALMVAIVLSLGVWVYALRSQPLNMEFTETTIIYPIVTEEMT